MTVLLTFVADWKRSAPRNSGWPWTNWPPSRLKSVGWSLLQVGIKSRQSDPERSRSEAARSFDRVALRRWVEPKLDQQGDPDVERRDGRMSPWVGFVR